MSAMRSLALWVTGLIVVASTAWIHGSVAPFGPWYPMAVAVMAGFTLTAWGVMHQKQLLDGAAIVSVSAFILVGPRPGVSAIVSAAGLALSLVAYFMLRLEARINEDGQDTTEGRQRSHRAVVFAGRRILMVVSASTGAALLLLHLPMLLAPWISPRWAVSIDATSVPVLLVFVIPYLVLATAWTLIRLGRRVPGPFQETTSGKTEEVHRHD